MRSTNQRDDTIILGDVGGTNCRLAIWSTSRSAIIDRMSYATEDYSTATEAIASFVARTGVPPGRASLALACPIVDDRPQLTNTSWRFDRKELIGTFGWDELVLVNDLAAQARAVSMLAPDCFIPIGAVTHRAPPRPTLVIGPGTGLGLARIEEGGIAASEGGHAGFSPGDAVEMELLQVLRREVARVTNETVISGPGLVRLYRAFSLLRGQAPEAIAGPEVMRRALAQECRTCVETCERFALLLGSVVGDAALMLGSASVVFVGAIAGAMAPVMQQGAFRRRFDERGPHRGFLADVPVFLTAEPDLGLHGARAVLEDRLGSPVTAG